MMAEPDLIQLPGGYILIPPLFGVFSEIVSTYSASACSAFVDGVPRCTTILSYPVWLHHFFIMGSGASVNSCLVSPR